MNSLNTSPKIAFAFAGTFLFLAGALVLMGIITGEVFYPAPYSTSTNEISDLGATKPPDSIIYQPSATIFNLTMILTGIMILIATYFVHVIYRRIPITLSIGFLGLGALGVGLFPGNNPVTHPIFSLLTFISGGLAAILSALILRAPFRYIAPCFGIVGLTSLFMSSSLMPILGDGGVERWVAYPIVLWIIGFGGYLLGSQPLQQE
ncbi:MAG: DUF998 domain-containing protein [Anaerolineae bacterium]